MRRPGTLPVPTHTVPCSPSHSSPPCRRRLRFASVATAPSLPGCLSGPRSSSASSPPGARPTPARRPLPRRPPRSRTSRPASRTPPDRPCERLPGYDPDFWTAEQADRTDAYLDASALCLRALLRGDVVGRRGACADVYPAYVADARDGRRDLDGRLDEAEAGRAFGLAYSAVVAARSARTAESMREDGRDKDADPVE